MVTSGNRFAKLAVPPREKRGSSAATLKSKIFDDTPVNEHAVELARFLPPAQLAARPHWPAQMTTTSRDRALAAALNNSGHPAQCGQWRRSRKPGWATQVAASPPKAQRAYMAVPRRRSDLIAFSAIIAKRRNAEARVGRSGSSRRYSSIIARRLS